MTAPERMWAPTSEPFSTTTTLMSGEICLSRMAAASPAGPAPTMTTSNSIASRAGSSVTANPCRILLLIVFPRLPTPDNRQHARPRDRTAAMTPDRAKDRTKAARELLAFYVEAGADAPVGEIANDYLSDNNANSPRVASPLAGEVGARSAPGGGSSIPNAPPSPTLPRKGGGSAPAQAAMITPPGAEAAVMAAREAARSAASMDELRTILDR